MSNAVAVDGTVSPGLTSSGASGHRASRAGWSVFQLALVSMLAALDRQAFAVLLVPIQKSLRVSDAAMGLLTGTAFAVVYAAVAVPIARLADRMNRRNLISVAMLVWSTATAACGIAFTFTFLLLARVAVGVSEAALGPAASSMIADIVPARRRGTAFGLLLVGLTIGYVLGAGLAGLLSDRIGWHLTLAAVGGPGVLLAVLFFVSVPEPVRERRLGSGNPPADSSVMDCVRCCWRSASLRRFIAANWFQMFYYGGWVIWAPAFLMRVHHLTATRMGLLFGALIAPAILSNIAAGVISDRIAARRGERWRAYINAVCLVIAAPLMVCALLASSLTVAFALILAYSFVGGGLTTVATTIQVSVSPPQMRGAISSIVYLLTNILAGAVSPLIIGVLSDALKQRYGEDALRYALMILPASMLISAFFYHALSRTLERDLHAAAT